MLTSGRSTHITAPHKLRTPTNTAPSRKADTFPMKHSVPHSLGQEKAKKVAEEAFKSYQNRFAEYKPTVSWPSSDRADIGFSVKGVSLKGSVDVKPNSIDLDLDVPFMLRPFKGRALGVIEDEIKKWIGKAEAGEL